MAWICPSCNFEENNETSVRCSCGYEVSYNEEPNYTKLGGWLLFVLLGQVLTILFYSINLIIWVGALNGEPSYLVKQEIIYSIIILVPSVFILFLLLKKSKILPVIMISYYIVAILLTFSRYLRIKSMTNLPNYYDHLNGAIDLAVYTFVSCAVWAAYFKFSKRVKNTFVN